MRLNHAQRERCFALLLASTLLASGCSTPAPDVQLDWFNTRHLTGDVTGLPGAGRPLVADSPGVRLTAPINATVSFGLTVAPGVEPIEQVRLSVRPFSSLDGRLDRRAVRVFRIHDVPVPELPGWHLRAIPPERRRGSVPDVLVPIGARRGGLPEQLSPGRRFALWVDVFIPKTTNAGRYTTAIDVSSAGRTLASLPVEIDVPPLVVPDVVSRCVVAEIDHRALFRHATNSVAPMNAPGLDAWSQDPRGARFNRQIFDVLRLLRDHGLTPVLPQLEPVAKITRRGELALDWEQFDRIVGPCLDGSAFLNRVGVQVWPLPSAPQPRRLMVSSRGSMDESDRAAGEFLDKCVRHFADRGWLDRTYLLVPADGFRSDRSAPRARSAAEAVRSSNPGLTVLARDCPQDLEPYGWDGFVPTPLEDVVDGWLTPAQFYDPAVMKDRREGGHATWVELDDPPYFGSVHVAAPAAFTRALTWIGDRLGAGAVHLGVVNRWAQTPGASGPAACITADPNVLIYPGRPFGLDEPVASVRLKRLRDSILDAKLRAMMRQRRLEHVVDALRNALVAYAGTGAYRTHYANGRSVGWAEDMAQYDRAREVMLDALSARDVPAHESSGASLQRATTWQRLMDEAEQVRLDVDGCNVRYTGDHQAWSAEALCGVTITNRRRAPFTGRLRFKRLPPGWRDEERGRPVGPLGPQESTRLLLTIEAGAVPPAAADGHVELPIELVGESGHRVERTARIALVTALPQGDRITIDGDLNDWPLGSVNTLGAFRLITGDSRGNAMPAASTPRSDTVGFVLLGNDGLYVAVNSSLSAAAATLTRSRNAVHYDGLLPVGEDLIEVLLEPFNSGTRAPADLFHLVVKPTGAYLTERGIDVDPPVGPRHPWAADWDVASRIEAGRWWVEMRIPWTAFDGIARSNRVWGLNLTRFDKTHMEYSTWSGAVGTAYDPLSLGNVFLPALPSRAP